MTERHGGCLCGQVRYRLTADPVRTLADPAGALREMLSRGEIEVGDEEEDEDE